MSMLRCEVVLKIRDYLTMYIYTYSGEKNSSDVRHFCILSAVKCFTTTQILSNFQDMFMYLLYNKIFEVNFHSLKQKRNTTKTKLNSLSTVLLVKSKWPKITLFNIWSKDLCV